MELTLLPKSHSFLLWMCSVLCIAFTFQNCGSDGFQAYDSMQSASSSLSSLGFELVSSNGKQVYSGQSTQLSLLPNQKINLDEIYVQWVFNPQLENKIVGSGLSLELFINNLEKNKSGTYQALIRYKTLAYKSSILELEVVEAPVQTFAPEITSGNYMAGQNLIEGNQVLLQIEALGFPTPEYQWYKDDSLLENENNSYLNISSVSEGDSGTYRVLVFNGIGSSTMSRDFIVNVLLRPVIVNDLNTNIEVVAGSNVGLEVGVLGTGPWRYFWSKNGQPLTNSGNSINLTNVSEVDEGSYQVEIESLSSGLTVDSNVSILSVQSTRQVERCDGVFNGYNMARDNPVGTGLVEYISGTSSSALNYCQWKGFERVGSMETATTPSNWAQWSNISVSMYNGRSWEEICNTGSGEAVWSSCIYDKGKLYMPDRSPLKYISNLNCCKIITETY